MFGPLHEPFVQSTRLRMSAPGCLRGGRKDDKGKEAYNRHHSPNHVQFTWGRSTVVEPIKQPLVSIHETGKLHCELCGFVWVSTDINSVNYSPKLSQDSDACSGPWRKHRTNSYELIEFSYRLNRRNDCFFFAAAFLTRTATSWNFQISTFTWLIGRWRGYAALNRRFKVETLSRLTETSSASRSSPTKSTTDLDFKPTISSSQQEVKFTLSGLSPESNAIIAHQSICSTLLIYFVVYRLHDLDWHPVTLVRSMLTTGIMAP